MNQPASSARRWVPRLLLAAVLLAAGALGARLLLRPEVQVATVKLGTAVLTVPGVVEVKAEYTNELKSEVGGRIIQSVLEPGWKVRQGELLVQLDTGDIDLEIERLRHEMAAARKRAELGSTLRAEVLNARDSVAEFERLVQEGRAPAAELEKRRRSLQQMEQRLELDEVGLKLSVENLQTQLRARERERGKMSITAPADGTIVEVLPRVGDLIGSNTPIARLMSNSRTVEAKLSEEHFASVKLGQKATVRFLTHGGNQYNAVVSKILPAADPVTQRYTVELTVTMPEDRVLAPGLSGEVVIMIAERPGAVIVPRRALLGEHVYVLAEGRLALRGIKKGYEGMNEVEILEGLRAGEQVLVEELDRFRDGDRVRPAAP